MLDYHILACIRMGISKDAMILVWYNIDKCIVSNYSLVEYDYSSEMEGNLTYAGLFNSSHCINHHLYMINSKRPTSVYNKHSRHYQAYYSKKRLPIVKQPPNCITLLSRTVIIDRISLQSVTTE